jgi:hypothetical protein
MHWIALIVLAVMLPEILSSIFNSKMGQAMAARVSGPGGSGTGAEEGQKGELKQRVRDLEGEVERLSREVERLGEAGEFLQRLLDDRSLRRGGDANRLPAGPEDG